MDIAPGAALPDSATVDQRVERALSVRDHADKLKSRLAAQGKLAADESTDTTAGMPDFSAGTASPDAQPTPEQTALPDFKAETVAPDLGTTPTPAPPEAPPAQATAASDAAAQAANQAAEELEEWEFEDPDLNVKIPIKFPKQYAQVMKRAVPRRADYDRMRTRWGEAASILEPMLQDGSLRQFLPFIQMARTDQEFSTLVAQIANRRQMGLPMIEQIQQAAAQAAQMTPPAPAGQGDVPVDPWLDEVLRNDPRLKRIDSLEERLAAADRERAERDQQARQQAAFQQQNATKMSYAHQDLERMYPGQFSTGQGPNDPGFQKAMQFARDYGYLNDYDLRAAIIFGAQRWMEQEAERRSFTASPAAETLQQVDTAQLELARRQAASLAAPGAGGVTQASVPTPPPPRPSRFQADGKTLKPSEQFLAEMKAWHMQAAGRA